MHTSYKLQHLSMLTNLEVHVQLMSLRGGERGEGEMSHNVVEVTRGQKSVQTTEFGTGDTIMVMLGYNINVIMALF